MYWTYFVLCLDLFPVFNTSSYKYGPICIKLYFIQHNKFRSISSLIEVHMLHFSVINLCYWLILTWEIVLKCYTVHSKFELLTMICWPLVCARRLCSLELPVCASKTGGATKCFCQRPSPLSSRLASTVPFLGTSPFTLMKYVSCFWRHDFDVLVIVSVSR